MPALIQHLNLPAGARASPALDASSLSPRLWNPSTGAIRSNVVSLVANHRPRDWQRNVSNRSWIAAAAAAKSKWLLEPIGDGDCRHIGEKIPLPSAIELSTDAATVGRVSDKADIVIPVGTVSGIHARLEKKDSVLLVTDLDSTNGTFINNKRVRPGAVTRVPPGSSITFGDEHLAQFKFSMVEDSDVEED